LLESDDGGMEVALHLNGGSGKWYYGQTTLRDSGHTWTVLGVTLFENTWLEESPHTDAMNFTACTHSRSQ
jgi:hypothetical protein